jgi:hypothetical protein
MHTMPREPEASGGRLQGEGFRPQTSGAEEEEEEEAEDEDEDEDERRRRRRSRPWAP